MGQCWSCHTPLTFCLYYFLMQEKMAKDKLRIRHSSPEKTESDGDVRKSDDEMYSPKKTRVLGRRELKVRLISSKFLQWHHTKETFFSMSYACRMIAQALTPLRDGLKMFAEDANAGKKFKVLLRDFVWQVCQKFLILFFVFFVLIWWQTDRKQEILHQSCKGLFFFSTYCPLFD